MRERDRNEGDHTQGRGIILIDGDRRKVLNLKEVGDDFEFFAQLSKMSTFFETAKIEHCEFIEI